MANLDKGRTVTLQELLVTSLAQMHVHTTVCSFIHNRPVGTYYCFATTTRPLSLT